MSKNLNLTFYSDNDLEQINDNIDHIEADSLKTGYRLLDPNNEEYDKVRNIILNFIKQQGRVVYGGSAYHNIIQKYRRDIDSEKRIYPEWERYDIEFYSPTPIRDLIMICNKLNDEGIKYVMGRQAQHDETFTVFANFLQYCDMSYMPRKIYDKIEFIEIDGIKYIHPEMILIDIFRMYNDPLTSFWRLSKVFKRMKLLMEKFHYDFKSVDPIKLVGDKDSKSIIDFVLPKLVDKYDKILFTGQLGYLVYTNPDKEFDTNKYLSEIELISDDPITIGKFIKSLTYQWAESNGHFKDYDDIFSIKFYSRFFQYWDKRVIIYYKNKPVFTIIGSSGRCLPFNNSTLKLNNKIIDIKIGSFLVIFNYYFIGYYYCKIHEYSDDNYYYANRDIINSLLTVRNNYLKDKDKTVLDSSIYKEFVIDCIGKTVEFSREFLLRMSEKRAKGEKGLMTYDPNLNKGSYIEYEFEQSDGLESSLEK